MSIATKLAELTQIRTDIRTALAGKGISASTHDFADFSQDIDDIQTGGGARLPAEYQEVEWVGSSGTQRIETGLYINALNVPLFYETNGISFDSISTRQVVGSQGGFYFGVVSNKWQVAQGGTTSINISLTANTFYSVKVYYSGVYKGSRCVRFFSQEDGASIFDTWENGSIEYSANNTQICLFSLNEQNLPSSCKIKDFIIYQGGTLARHFVPCYRIADSVIGMYDLVGEQFYTNAGTGTFTKGADV